MYTGNGAGTAKNGLHPDSIAIPEDKTAAALFGDVWEHLTGSMSPSMYPARVQFLEQGSQSSDVYFIRSGIIKLRSVDRAGQETIVGVRRTGGLVGAEAALLGKPHLVSAVTVTECCLERLPARRFCHLVRTHPHLSWYLHLIGASELRATTQALLEVKSHAANVRLKRLILELAPELREAGSQKGGIRLPLKNWEIAQMLGVTPEHLSRLLRRLEKEGFLGHKGVVLITRSSHSSPAL